MKTNGASSGIVVLAERDGFLRKKGALLDAPHPKSIVLGCMVRPEFEAAVQSYCKEQKINLYKMQKAKAEYRLEKLSVLEFDN